MFSLICLFEDGWDWGVAAIPLPTNLFAFIFFAHFKNHESRASFPVSQPSSYVLSHIRGVRVSVRLCLSVTGRNESEGPEGRRCNNWIGRLRIENTWSLVSFGEVIISAHTHFPRCLVLTSSGVPCCIDIFSALYWHEVHLLTVRRYAPRDYLTILHIIPTLFMSIPDVPS